MCCVFFLCLVCCVLCVVCCGLWDAGCGLLMGGGLFCLGPCGGRSARGWPQGIENNNRWVTTREPKGKQGKTNTTKMMGHLINNSWCM